MNQANLEQSELVAQIETLRQQLNRQRYIYIIAGIILLPTVIILGVWVWKNFQFEGKEGIAKYANAGILLAILAAIGGCLRLMNSGKKIALDYSTRAKTMLDQASNALLPARLSLHSNLGLDEALILGSMFVERRKIEYIHSSELLQGEIEGLGFRSARVEIAYRERGILDKPLQVEMMLFAAANLPYQIAAQVLVVDDWAQKGLGKLLGGFMQQLNSERGLTVHHLQHEAAFEKEFAVYTDQPREAERLLSPAICQFLLTNAQSGHRISLNFSPKGIMVMIKSESIPANFPLDIKAGDYIPQRIKTNLSQRVKTAQTIAHKLKTMLSDNPQ